MHESTRTSIEMLTNGMNDLTRVVDNILAGHELENQIETLLEVGSIMEERWAMREALKGLTREQVHTR